MTSFLVHAGPHIPHTGTINQPSEHQKHVDLNTAHCNCPIQWPGLMCGFKWMDCCCYGWLHITVLTWHHFWCILLPVASKHCLPILADEIYGDMVRQHSKQLDSVVEMTMNTFTHMHPCIYPLKKEGIAHPFCVFFCCKGVCFGLCTMHDFICVGCLRI
jgi:hypothetical protein